MSERAGTVEGSWHRPHIVTSDGGIHLRSWHMQETLTSEGNNSPQRDAALIGLCSLNTVDNSSPFVDLLPDAPWCRGCCCTAACSDEQSTVTLGAHRTSARPTNRPRATPAMDGLSVVGGHQAWKLRAALVGLKPHQYRPQLPRA